MDIEMNENEQSISQSTDLAMNSCNEIATINDSDQYIVAGEMLMELARTGKEIEKMHKHLKEPILESGRRIDQFSGKLRAKVKAARHRLNALMCDYDKRQALIADEAQRARAEIAAKEKARADKAAAIEEAKARAKRQRETEKAMEMAAKGRDAEAEAKLKAAEEEEVRRLHAAEDKRQAAALLPPVPVLPASTPKVAGISTRKTWHFEIMDEAMIPREHMIPNQKSIGAVVRALQDKAGIPGIRIYCKESKSARAK